MREVVVVQDAKLEIRGHEKSILAGALGAAIWGAFRARKLSRRGFALAPRVEA